MTRIRITCRCGEVLHADVAHVGRKVRCRCGRTHTVLLPRAMTPSSRGAGWRSAVRRVLAKRPHAGKSAHPHTGRYPLALWTVYGALVYLALSVVAVVVVWGFGDRAWFGTVALFSGRWLLLLPLPFLVIAAALFHRRSLLVLAGAAAIVVGPVMGFRPGIGALRTGASDGQILRVAAFNATGNIVSMSELLSLMRQWEIDVALIQECPIRHAHEVTPWSVTMKNSLCAISRYPVRELDRINLDTIMPRNQSFGGTSTATRYELSLPNRTVTLVNVHLETARRGLRGLFNGDLGAISNNLVLRRAESRVTAEWIGDDVDNVIVAGDFNMPVESVIYRASWSHLRNAYSRAGRGFGFTRDNGWIRVRIDHVLSGRNWRARRAWVGPAIGSDHRPVFAELKWTPR